MICPKIFIVWVYCIYKNKHLKRFHWFNWKYFRQNFSGIHASGEDASVCSCDPKTAWFSIP